MKDQWTYQFWFVFLVDIFGTVLIIGWGQIVSCYFPFLLSRKHYVTINNQKLQKLLLSDRINPSPDTKTRPEDRNKWSLSGLIYYLLEAGIVCVIYILSFYILFLELNGVSIESRVVYDIWDDLTTYDGIFSVVFLLFYLIIDYQLGKLLNGTGK